MQIIYETSDYTDALIKKGMLEQAGFHVHMDNENAVGVMPYLGIALGQRLWVPDSEASGAKELVSDQPRPQDFPVNGDAIDTCPECGGWQVIRHRSLMWLPFFLVVDVLMAPFGGRHRKCLDCGYKYKTNASDLSWPLKILMGIAILYLLVLAWIWLN